MEKGVGVGRDVGATDDVNVTPRALQRATRFLVFSFAGSGSHETDDKSAESSAEQKAKPVRERPTGPFTVAQVAEHKTRDDAWLIIDGKVYDVTDFVDDHPGGDSILDNAGADSSAGFHGDQHPETVAEAVEEFYIGELKKDQ